MRFVPNKTRGTYDRLFAELKNLRPHLNPATVMADFEAAAIGAVRAEFPLATVKGCFYHLAQNVYRKVQSEGLQERYSTDVDFAVNVRSIVALAFVPIDQLVDTFETLQDSLDDEIAPIADYFEDNYIGRLRRNQRAAPKFEHELWSMYTRTEDELPRTNNHIEGGTARCSLLSTATTPTFGDFSKFSNENSA